MSAIHPRPHPNDFYVGFKANPTCTNCRNTVASKALDSALDIFIDATGTKPEATKNSMSAETLLAEYLRYKEARRGTS